MFTLTKTSTDWWLQSKNILSSLLKKSVQIEPWCDVGGRLLSYLCLGTVEHFLVGQRGDQAEAVTLGGLDVHDGRSGEPEPFPPDT